MTEERSIGYEEGYQAGWNAAMDAKPEQPAQQEPVAWMVWGENNVPSLTFTKPSDKYVFDSLYMTPPQRTWVGLTDEERKLARNSVGYNQFVTAGEYAEHVQKATEFKLMEKNT